MSYRVPAILLSIASLLLVPGCDDPDRSDAGSAPDASADAGPPAIDATAPGDGGDDAGPPARTPGFFVDATTGDDGNDGSAGSPWRTLAHARSQVPAGGVVEVAAGDYGPYEETSAPGHTDYVTFQAASGATPTLTGLSLRYGAPTDAYLRFDGFEITTTTSFDVVEIANARFVHIQSCDIHADRWARSGSGVDGFEVRTSEDVLLEGNHVHEVFRGASVQDNRRLTFRRNHIEPKAGTGVQYISGASGVIEFNHIHGAPYVGAPDNPDAPVDPHASIISVRSDDLVIRNNLLHGMGSTSAIMTYGIDAAGGEEAYEDILIENNAIYDTANSLAVRFFNLGANVVLRNNLIFSRQRATGDCPDGLTRDARYRYETAVIVQNVAPGFDGSGLSLHDNIIIGIVSAPSTVDDRNNLLWSWQDGSTWLTDSPSGTSTIAESAYENCGNHSTFFEDGFFETAPDLAFASGGVADFTLAAGSPAIDRGDASLQAAFDLGALDARGFVTGEHMRGPADLDVGPYERR